ncbi:MAG TPA: hypothetical protein PK431_03170 [Chitinophagales bacterium]|nr:hypothetical protein [Chitinophagales bacterium]
MQEYKYIYIITKNNKVNEVSSFQEVLDFYNDSALYIILVENKEYKKYSVNDFVTGYCYNIQTKNVSNQDVIITYENFKLRLLHYQMNVTYADRVPFYGFEFEIIDKNGDAYNRHDFIKLIANKSFAKDFLGYDDTISKAQSIINLMSFIKSFDDLKEIKDTFSSYK